MNDRRKLTNILGVVVLGTIIIGVTLERGIQWHKEQERIRKAEALVLESRFLTSRLANNLAAALVVDSSGDLVMKWARGEYLDSWKNSFVIEHNTKDNGACVRSYGADGLPNTEDDILSRIYDYEQTHFKIEPEPSSDKMEKIKEHLDGAKRKIGETFEDIKNSEVEKKGWSFEWKWGKK